MRFCYIYFIWGFLIFVTLPFSSSSRVARDFLQRMDKKLTEDPAAVYDSLSVHSEHFKKSDFYYYSLLYTIAQHKTHKPFKSDSLISAARQYYTSQTKDYYNQARSCFYHGVVLSKLKSNDTLSLYSYQQAESILNDNCISDDRLEALLSAYIGRINSVNSNPAIAAAYFHKAADAEGRLGNVRNQIIDYCDWLVSLVATENKSEADNALCGLDSLVANNPTIRIENINNAKAIYYLNIRHDLDSAAYYCQKWNPSPSDICAKQNLMANICQKQGKIADAIEWEKAAFSNRRITDSSLYHIYYERLASLYEQQGNTDSSAHYSQLAYKSLYDNYRHRSEKKILELEKKYNMAAKESQLEKARNQRNLLAVIVISLVLLSGVFGGLLYIRNRQLAADKLTKSVIIAAAKTHQNTLSQLRELRKRPMSRTVQSLQEDIGTITRNLHRGFTQNFSTALEENLRLLPVRTRKAAEQLSGERSKIIFILSELGYSENEIAEFTCTSIDSVRTIGNNNQKVLNGERNAPSEDEA